MKKLIFLSILLISHFVNAQIGIGTNTPSANAVLDVNSTNKGLMLPRLNNTAVVSNPTAGLMIYDQAKKAPAFHNGTAWQTLSSLNTVVANADSIVYTIGSANGFIAGTYRLENIATGGSQGEDKLTANLTIPIHANTLQFQKIFFQKLKTTGALEVLVYKKGGTTPIFSHKFTNITVLALSSGFTTGSPSQSVSYTIQADILGYKDWVNGSSFGWSYLTNPPTLIAY
jgi:hypothetical protein